MSDQTNKKLRKGYTTGACATAAAAAAYEALLTGHFPDPVRITLPKGKQVDFALDGTLATETFAEAGVIKDAGDDPDVTHGARIVSRVAHFGENEGIVFKAGEGVGMITRRGLALDVGEPAINPVPREMMKAAITAIAVRNGLKAPGGLEITVGVINGEKLAEKTLNARLGILGGLSILGTTGIVVPYSCSAWIHSIHRGIDVARANGLTHIAATTGRTSERAIQKMLGLEDAALIEMGDFAGGMLKYLRTHGIANLTLGGGIAKMSKLAAGHLDLHSSRSKVDVEELAAAMASLGAATEAVEKARSAVSAGAVMEIAREYDIPLGDAIARAARGVVTEVLGDKTGVEVLLFDRDGAIAGRSCDVLQGQGE